MGDTRLVKLGAGNGQHASAGIDADRPAVAVSQQFQHPAGSGAQIEQAIKRRAPDQRQNFRLHLLIRNMQAPQIVPAFGIGGEIGFCPARPRLLDNRKPLGVAPQIGVS